MDKDGLLVGLGVVGAIGAMAVLMMSVGECSDRRRQAARENERSVDQHKASSAAPTYWITMPLEEVDLYLGAFMDCSEVMASTDPPFVQQACFATGELMYDYFLERAMERRHAVADRLRTLGW